MTIENGDVVQLKSGSVDMTVGEIDVLANIASVVYFDFEKNIIVSDQINMSTLTLKGV